MFIKLNVFSVLGHKVSCEAINLAGQRRPAVLSYSFNSDGTVQIDQVKVATNTGCATLNANVISNQTEVICNIEESLR